MKGDTYRCPVCERVIKEGDCEYSEVYCHRTLSCRRTRGGWTPMVKVASVDSSHGV